MEMKISQSSSSNSVSAKSSFISHIEYNGDDLNLRNGEELLTDFKLDQNNLCELSQNLNGNC